jgi:hypothetical protein
MNVVPEVEFPGLANITIAKLISSGLSGLMVLAIVILVFVLIAGGVMMMTSGGNDSQSAGRGRTAVTGAIIGLFVVLGAWAIMSLLSKFFNVNLFQMNIPSMTD